MSGSTREQRRTLACWLLQQEPPTTPGTFKVSNTGYSLAGAILEEVSDTSWEILLSEKLFQPLGLTSVGFGRPAFDNIHQPRELVEEEIIDVQQTGYNAFPALLAPAVDIHMSISDFAQYGQLHLQGLHGNDRILTSETFEYLHTPIIDPENRIALGWHISEYKGELISNHEGSSGTYFSKIVLCHDFDFGCVICTNIGGETAAAACRNVYTELLDRYLPLHENVRQRKMESIYNKVVELLVFLRQINLRKGFELIAEQIREQVEGILNRQSPTREKSFTRIH
jgi:CubicO group peptidase (beta-lactamase class C family)